jgi:purine-nucleoside phosphorylase
MIDINSKYKTLITEIKNQSPFEPELALVLGSGLGDFSKSIETVKSIPTSSLIGYPKSTVHGHEGYIHFSKYGGKNLLIFQGRIHFYEGYKLYECILPSHIAKSLGCKKIILTNAAGGINSNFVPGDLMLIKSTNSINLMKEMTELLGIPTPEEKNKFLNFPSELINSKFYEAALEEKINLKEGVYWFGKGPSYETPSEIKMMAKYGIDAVGMSTVHEAIYAAVNGLEVSAVSCITNYAAGISQNKLDHSEVMETAEKVKGKFERLIKKVIELL